MSDRSSTPKPEPEVTNSKDPRQEYRGNETGKRGQGPPDPNRRAWEIVQQAVGEQPKEDPTAGKNPHAVALGRMGGLKGGAARKAALTPEQRKGIAQKAAAKRWGVRG